MPIVFAGIAPVYVSNGTPGENAGTVIPNVGVDEILESLVSPEFKQFNFVLRISLTCVCDRHYVRDTRVQFLVFLCALLAHEDGIIY